MSVWTGGATEEEHLPGTNLVLPSYFPLENRSFIKLQLGWLSARLLIWQQPLWLVILNYEFWQWPFQNICTHFLSHSPQSPLPAFMYSDTPTQMQVNRIILAVSLSHRLQIVILMPFWQAWRLLKSPNISNWHQIKVQVQIRSLVTCAIWDRKIHSLANLIETHSRKYATQQSFGRNARNHTAKKL